MHNQTLVQSGEDFVIDRDAVELGPEVKWQNVIGEWDWAAWSLAREGTLPVGVDLAIVQATLDLVPVLGVVDPLWSQLE